MNWFKCDCCGKLSRGKKDIIICNCGVNVFADEELKNYIFDEAGMKTIPPNPTGKNYKLNKKAEEEYKLMVMNYGRE